MGDLLPAVLVPDERQRVCAAALALCLIHYGIAQDSRQGFRVVDLAQPAVGVRSGIHHEIQGSAAAGCDHRQSCGHRLQVYLAKRLIRKIQEIEGVTVDLGILDITLYRDDLGKSKQNPALKKTEIPFPIKGKKIVLCDDVLFTGRTIRAAIDALMDFGRPSTVQLAVLIDRGHRELPIRPDYVGKNIPTSREMSVKVKMREEDEEDQVIILEANP